MSHEIQDQLQFLEASESSTLDRLHYLEEVVSEWDDVFGKQSALDKEFAPGSELTPKALYNKMMEQTRTIRDLEQRLVDAQNAQDDQNERHRAALQESDRVNRHHMQDEIARAQRDHEGEIRAIREETQRVLEQAKALYTKACRDIYTYKDEEAQALARQYDESISALEREKADLDRENDLLLARLKQQLTLQADRRDEPTPNREAEEQRLQEQSEKEHLDALKSTLRNGVPHAMGDLERRLEDLVDGLAHTYHEGPIPNASHHTAEEWRAKYLQLRQEYAALVASTANLKRQLEAKEALLKHVEKLEKQLKRATLEKEELERRAGRVTKAMDVYNDQKTSHDIQAAKDEIAALRTSWEKPVVQRVKNGGVDVHVSVPTRVVRYSQPVASVMAVPADRDIPHVAGGERVITTLQHRAFR